MNKVRAKLSLGKPAIGCFQSLPSPIVSEILGRHGFDWIVIDMQHGSVTWDMLGALIYAAEAGGALPLVRVGWNDSMEIMRALDLGAAGIIAPLVSTAEQAKLAADSCRYPPQGARSIGSSRMRASAISPEDDNRDVLCFVMIETAEGLTNLEQIASTPGIDGLFVGAADLALSLGMKFTDIQSPKLLDALDRVVAACNQFGITPGTVAIGDGIAEDQLRRGMRFIATGSDRYYVSEGARIGLAESMALVSELGR